MLKYGLRVAGVTVITASASLPSRVSTQASTSSVARSGEVVSASELRYREAPLPDNVRPLSDAARKGKS